jgi:amino acid adenylation domain-containing protein
MPVTDRASIAGWNATQSPYPRDASLVALLAAQVARTPDALALTDGRRAMTYRQLGSLSARVAARLRALSVGAGHRVGVASERSSSMVAALLGILETGACYVPLDPSYPQQRLRYIIEDSGISALILAGPESEALAPLCPNTLDLNEIAASGDEPDTTIIGDRSGSVAPAYLIYTSGSTGKPKGVVVPQRAVVNFLHGMQHVLQLEQADRLLAVTTLSFDIAVLELLLPLMTGASVVIATNDEARDPRALRRLVGENAITIMQATPTLWRLLLDDEWWAPPAGFTGLCGGEPMTTELARAMCARGVRPWNLYGPTETTVWSTAWPVPQDFEQIRIGRPIANTTVRVLDAAMRPVPIGVPGELWIGGDGLAIGYHDRTELTAERFRPDPHGDDGARLYRTGDRGRWCRDGQLQHLGRVDHQIKLRGHRIEPGEIESQLRALCATQEAVVLVRQIASRDADALVAYVLSPAGAALDEVTLRAALRERLPDVMIPEFIVALDELPRLPNGKLDRSALPEPSTRAIGVESSAADTRPSGEREIQLAEIWSHVLGVPSVRADDNFFDLGGHSLLVMQAMGRMESACGRKINPRLYVFQTLRQIAAAYDEAPEVEDRPQGLLRRLFGGLRRGSGAGT